MLADAGPGDDAGARPDAPGPLPGPGSLDAQIGQRVVDVVASTIRQDLNLMDAHGTVIASTVADRIGRPHRAARRVLSTGRPVAVTQVVEGVVDRPGINVPLEVDGELAGVVGVTGDPEHVEQLAHVVALTIQLLLTQEREHDSDHLTRTLARELVATLCSSTASAPAVRERLAATGLGVGPWSIGVWAAAVPHQDGSATPPRHAEHLVTTTNDRRPDARPGSSAPAGATCAIVLHGLLWVVTSGGRRLDPSLGGAGTRAVVVDALDDVDELASWAHDLRALGRLARLLPHAADRATWNADLAVTVAHLPDSTRRRLARTAARLAPVQRETVRAVTRAPSLSAGAALLFVHRNTLLQRVERIRTLTGLDLRRADDAAVLRSATMAYDAVAADGDEGRTHT